MKISFYSNKKNINKFEIETKIIYPQNSKILLITNIIMNFYLSISLKLLIVRLISQSIHEKIYLF